jgi:peptidoglycan/xylan/chitin deacetylase (PgdA/CDA1 family)
VPLEFAMIRRLVKGLLATDLLLRRAHRRTPPGIAVLMYHEVLGDDDSIEAWSAVRASDLRRQIEYLKSAVDIMSIDEALTRGDAVRPAAVLTFDDGGAGNYQYLLPVVEEARVPVTVFVATGHVESGRVYWFDRVVNALQVVKPLSLDLRDAGLSVYAVGPPSGADNWAQIQRLLLDIKAAGVERNEELGTLVEERARAAGAAVRAPLQPMTIEQVRKLAACPHVTIGAHSHAHSLLTQMSAADATADVAMSRRLLQQWTGQSVEHFAYPSGGYDASVREIVVGCGFRTAFGTEKRLWRSGSDLFAIPRLSIGRYDSNSRLRIALAGGTESVLRAQF